MIAKVLSLKKDQAMMDEVMEGYKAERIELEKKYSVMKEKFFEMRTKVVSGEIVPEISELSEEAQAIPVEEGEEVTGIPQFWLNCLNNCSATSSLIQEDDVPALEALSDIKCTYDEKYTEFTLTFFFTENEYFSNTELTKKYGVSPDLLDEVSPALTLNER
jgi:nucleosome assembly protein 1-like 1